MNVNAGNVTLFILDFNTGRKHEESLDIVGPTFSTEALE
jgi:hypothetical protein